MVVSRFNNFVTDRLREGALAAIAQSGGTISDDDVIEIPGAWEFPVTVRALARLGYDAIICLGAVIRGDTPHFDYVAGEAARGIADASVASGVPMAFGILTTNTVEQATDRAGGKHGNKGFDAAMTAIEMALLLRAIRKPQATQTETAEMAVAKLMARHKAREQTLQMLFEWDLRRTPLDEIARGYYESLLVSEDSVAKPRPDAFAQDLLRGRDTRASGNRRSHYPARGELASGTHARGGSQCPAPRDLRNAAHGYARGGSDRRSAGTGAAFCRGGIGAVRQWRARCGAERIPGQTADDRLTNNNSFVRGFGPARRASARRE